MTPDRLLITGAAGAIGTTLRSGLRGVARRLRLNDLRPLVADDPGEEIELGDLHDPEVAERVTSGVDCMVHLAGVPREAAWEPVLRNNIEALFTLFEAARRNRVRRIIFASTNHVIGFHRADREVGPDAEPRPDSRYAASKVFGEALARLYADKHGIEVACLRIGSFRQRPENARQRATWVSPRDLTGLVRACIAVEPLHYEVFYGVSANRLRKWRDAAEARLGFVPEDDADDFAAGLGEASGRAAIGELFHGGENCEREFSGNPGRIE